MDRLRKIFTISVMMITVLAMSVVIVPSAGAADAGDLVKMDGLSSVYYLGADGNRYVFPNEATYYSWYTDFSGVVTIPQEELETYTLLANVVIRAGTKLITSPSNSMVYAVEPDGVLRSIVSEENAISLYGEDWATQVVDVIDSFFTNYTVGDPLTEGQYPAGQLIKTADAADVYYYDGTNVRTFTDEAAFLDNRFSWDYIMTVPDTYTLPAAGTDITALEDALIDTSQGGGGVGPVAGTGLTIALASDTPAAITIPVNASVEFLKFNLTASSDGDINVTSIKLTAGGLGVATDIDNVALYNDGGRIGNVRNIDSNNEAAFNFSSPLVIEAGSTEKVVVKASATDGTAQHFLGIKAASDFVTNSTTISGSFPINGNTMSVSDVTVGELTIAADGIPASPDLGDTDATIAKFKLTNDSVEDITFNSIVLKRSAGSADNDDFENVVLKEGGSVVATSDGLVGKFVNFTLDTPMSIEKGKTKKFQVVADVIDGAGKDFTISLDNAADIDAVGDYYSQSSLITGTFTGTSLTIAAGAIALGKENAVATKVRIDQIDVELGTITITPNSGTQVEVSTLELTITSTNDAKIAYSLGFDTIENIEVYDSATRITYELTYTSGTASKLYSNTDMGLFMAAGVTTELVVRADTLASSTDEDYTVSIATAYDSGTPANSHLIIKETEDDTQISDITPNSITLKKVTIEAPTVTLSTNPLSAAYNAVVGTEDVEVINFNMEANSVDDLKVTELKFKDRSTTAITFSVVSELKLFKTGVATPILTKGGAKLVSEEVTFDDLALTVPKSGTVEYYVTVSFVDDSGNNGATTTWYLSGYTIEDEEESDAVYDATNDAYHTANAAAGNDGIIDSNDTVGYAALLSARVVTLKSTGSLFVQMDNTNDETSSDSYEVANTATGLLAAVKFRAENEEIAIDELVVVVNDGEGTLYTNVANMIDTLYLIDSDKVTVLASTSNISASTTIAMDYIVGETSQTMYIRADFNKIGKYEVGEIDASSTLRIAHVSAEGYSSGNVLAAAAPSAAATCDAAKICYDSDGSNTFTTADSTFHTAVSKIVGAVGVMTSNVELVSTYGGYDRDTLITGTGEYNAAIIKVTIDASDNTLANGNALKMVLKEIKVTVDKNDNTVLSDVTIEKIGGSGNSTSTTDTITTTSTVEYARFNMAGGELGTDDEISQGSTVYFLVKVTIGTCDSGTADDWIKVGLDSLNGTATGDSAAGANFTWQDGTDAKSKFPLRLSKTKIDGVKIYETT